VQLAAALQSKTTPQALSGGRSRHRFDGFTLTLVGVFDFEAMTLTYMGTLFGFYNAMELFLIRRGEVVDPTPEEYKLVVAAMEQTLVTLEGLR
jgi:hypothetical protein